MWSRHLSTRADPDVHAALATKKQHRVRRLPVEGFGGTVLGIVYDERHPTAAGPREPVREAEVVNTFQAIAPIIILAAHRGGPDPSP